MRYWDNKEKPGRGLQYCLVIDPEDGTHPIRTYGWSEMEVLEKVARTAETAQQLINRQRENTSTSTARPAQVAPPARKPVSSEELMTATADLNNPAKAAGAVKTLLRSQGFDVDEMRQREDMTNAANTAQQWERAHPDYPSDPRNDRQMMDRALLLVNGNWAKITPQVFDQVYEYLTQHRMLHEPEAPKPSTIETPPAAPNGNSATVERPRTATGIPRRALSGARPVATTTAKFTRAEVDQMNSKQFRDKMESDPEFVTWYNAEYSRPATA